MEKKISEIKKEIKEKEETLKKLKNALAENTKIAKENHDLLEKEKREQTAWLSDLEQGKISQDFYDKYVSGLRGLEETVNFSPTLIELSKKSINKVEAEIAELKQSLKSSKRVRISPLVALLLVVTFSSMAIGSWFLGHNKGVATTKQKIETEAERQYWLGYHAGLGIGKNEGYKTGRTEGFEKGYDVGHDFGVYEGFDILGYGGGQYIPGKKDVLSWLPYSIDKETGEPIGGIVFITLTGKDYHKDGCSHLSKSQISIEAVDAKLQGYSACSQCW